MHLSLLLPPQGANQKHSLVSINQSEEKKLIWLIHEQIEYDTNCSKNYLDVRDGTSESNSLLHNESYCGDLVPIHYKTTGRYAFLKFEAEGPPKQANFSVQLSKSTETNHAPITK